MKAVRLLFLLLLVALLPIRGAMAAAMLCPMGDMQKPAVAVMSHGDGSGCHEEPSTESNEGCKLCASFCSLTPLPCGFAPLAAPIDPATTAFAEVAAPAPSFMPEGLERPPRTC